MTYKVLSIAGFDGSGGAGLQADLKTFSALGCYGMTVLTALPVQNTQGVKSVYEIPIKCIDEQIFAIFEDIEVDAVKIGMLHNAEIIELVAHNLQNFAAKKIVLDPVMVSKSGHKLLQIDAIAALKQYLLPLATIITPNIPEAEELLGIKILTEADMAKAASKLLDLGPQSVLLKGGHLNSTIATDVLIRDGKADWFTAQKINTKNTHGTGCTLSAAITAFLAQNYSIKEAVELAKTYISNAIKAGSKQNIGKGHGPVHHFYHLWPNYKQNLGG